MTMTDASVAEFLIHALREKIVETSVVCIEGCGTSVIADPSILEKVGDRITGSDSAEPDNNIIDIVGEDNILDPETAKVDNIEGVCVVYDHGMHDAVVTTGSLNDAQVMRDMFGSDLCIVGIFDNTPDGIRAHDLLDIISVKGSKLEFVTTLGKKLSE